MHRNPRMHPQMTPDGDKAQMSTNGDIALLQAENVRIQTELNVANAALYDEREGISAATKWNQFADELYKRFWQLEEPLRHYADGEISKGRLREIFKMWLGGDDPKDALPSFVQRPDTPHIDRGPGFTHSDPAETCGCAFDPLPQIER